MSDPNEPAFPIPNTYHANGQIEYGPTSITYRQWMCGQVAAGGTKAYMDDDETKESTAFIVVTLADAIIAQEARTREEVTDDEG